MSAAKGLGHLKKRYAPLNLSPNDCFRGRGDSEEEVDDGEDEVFGKILGTATVYEWSTLEDL